MYVHGRQRHEESALPATTSSLATPSSHAPSPSAALASHPPAECPTSSALSAPVSSRLAATVSFTFAQRARAARKKRRYGREYDDAETKAHKTRQPFQVLVRVSCDGSWAGLPGHDAAVLCGRVFEGSGSDLLLSCSGRGGATAFLSAVVQVWLYPVGLTPRPSPYRNNTWRLRPTDPEICHSEGSSSFRRPGLPPHAPLLLCGCERLRFFGGGRTTLLVLRPSSRPPKANNNKLSEEITFCRYQL